MGIVTLKPGDRVAGYILIEKLGCGELGEVWKAHPAERPTEAVALKIAVDPDRFRALRSMGTQPLGLNHSAVVRTLAIDSAHEPPFLVMEYVLGPSLRELLDSGRRLTLEEAAGAMAEVLDVLAYAHERGVIHGNLEPASLMFEPAGAWAPGVLPENRRMRLLGFGPGMVARGATEGSPLSYLAPETRQGELADVQSDLYAAGAVLFEALVGRPPVGDEAASEAAEGLPVVLDGVLRKALRAQPERRYATAREMKRDLEACVSAAGSARAQAEGDRKSEAKAPPAGERFQDQVKRVVDEVRGRQTLDLSRAFNDAFGALASNTVTLLLAGLLWGLLSFATLFILAGPLTAGLCLMLVRVIRDRREVQVGDLFSSFDRFLGKSLGFIGLILLALIGFAHLVIPGILVSAFGMYVFFVMADRRTSFADAVNQSVRLVWTHGLLMHAMLATLTILMSVAASAMPGELLTAWLLTPFFVGLQASAYLQVTGERAAAPGGDPGVAPARAAA